MNNHHYPVIDIDEVRFELHQRQEAGIDPEFDVDSLSDDVITTAIDTVSTSEEFQEHFSHLITLCAREVVDNMELPQSQDLT